MNAEWTQQKTNSTSTMDPRTKRPTPYDLMQTKAPKNHSAEHDELLGLWKHYRQRTAHAPKR